MQARGRGCCCGQACLSELSAGSDQASAWACLLAGGRELKRTGDTEHVTPSFSGLLTRSSAQRALCLVLKVTMLSAPRTQLSEAMFHFDERTPLSSLPLCLCLSPARGLHTVPEICQKTDCLISLYPCQFAILMGY